MIDEAGCDKIDAAGVKFINAYSVMTCSSKEGVCATCYGRDLSERLTIIFPPSRTSESLINPGLSHFSFVIVKS